MKTIEELIAEFDAANPTLVGPDGATLEGDARLAALTAMAQEEWTRLDREARWQAILDDRLTLPEALRGEVEWWDLNEPAFHHQGVLQELEAREEWLRRWAAESLARKEAVQEAQAQEAAKLARSQTRTALRAQWDQLCTQYPWLNTFRKEFEAANVLLDEGRDTDAVEMINRTPVPIDYDEATETLVSVLDAAERATFRTIKQQFAAALTALPK